MAICKEKWFMFCFLLGLSNNLLAFQNTPPERVVHTHTYLWFEQSKCKGTFGPNAFVKNLRVSSDVGGMCRRMCASMCGCV